jgi:rRNA maturation endonuclease Nob1
LRRLRDAVDARSEIRDDVCPRCGHQDYMHVCAPKRESKP